MPYSRLSVSCNGRRCSSPACAFRSDMLATQTGSNDFGLFTNGIIQALDEAPAVDAVPVVHGKWIRTIVEPMKKARKF